LFFSPEQKEELTSKSFTLTLAGNLTPANLKANIILTDVCPLSALLLIVIPAKAGIQE
jgi:hypothetical protein